MTASPDEPSVFKFLEVTMDRFANVASIAELRNVTDGLPVAGLEWRPGKRIRFHE
jgi:hypothetical protein